MKKYQEKYLREFAEEFLTEKRPAELIKQAAAKVKSTAKGVGGKVAGAAKKVGYAGGKVAGKVAGAPNKVGGKVSGAAKKDYAKSPALQKAAVHGAKVGKYVKASPLKSAAMAVGAAAAFWTAYRGLGAAFSKAKKECGTFKIGKKRKLCMLQVNIRETDKKIALIKQKAATVCSTAKDPEKCKEKMKAMVAKLEEKKSRYMNKLKEMGQ